MKTLYEFLVKQHVNPNKENEFELYQHKLREDMVYMLINNMNSECFDKNVKLLPIIKYYREGYKKAIDNNLVLIIRPCLHGDAWIAWNINGITNNDFNKQFISLNKTITIDNFTGEYWEKNKWCTK